MIGKHLFLSFLCLLLPLALLLGGCPKQQPAGDNAQQPEAAAAPEAEAPAGETPAETASAAPEAVNMDELAEFSGHLAIDASLLAPHLESFSEFDEESNVGQMHVFRPCKAGFANEAEFQSFVDILRGDVFEDYARETGTHAVEALVDSEVMRIIILKHDKAIAAGQPRQVEMGLLSFGDRSEFEQMLSGMQKQ
ncbi:MAG: hypothetical protein H7A35_14350 [Planctomycetales bacterium]|nr:hypothetical protein [bacterium]UNM08017.1 MAG: hypothetical protein H7A35_14350 [Planctomycetales bacterium]